MRLWRSAVEFRAFRVGDTEIVSSQLVQKSQCPNSEVKAATLFYFKGFLNEIS